MPKSSDNLNQKISPSLTVGLPSRNQLLSTAIELIAEGRAAIYSSLRCDTHFSLRSVRECNDTEQPEPPAAMKENQLDLICDTLALVPTHTSQYC